MSLRNTDRAWGWPARALHWSMAAIMIFLLAVGFYMVELLGTTDLIRRFQLTQLHKSWGFVVFALALVRIAWRLANPVAPEDPAGAAPWENRAARLAHLVLYALMIVLPVSGWLMASASPLNDAGAYPMQVRNMVFGLFELPDPVNPGSRTLEAAFKAVHLGAALLLTALLAVHAGAALRHHFLLRDDVLRRMTRGAAAAPVTSRGGHARP